MGTTEGVEVRRATVTDAATAGRLLFDFNTEFESPTPSAAEFTARFAALIPRDDVIVLLAVGQGFVSPTLTALVAAEAPPERRGEVLGWVQSSGAMARIVGPVSAGILFDAVGPGAPFLVGAVFYGVALAVVAGIDRQ